MAHSSAWVDSSLMSVATRYLRGGRCSSSASWTSLAYSPRVMIWMVRCASGVSMICVMAKDSFCARLMSVRSASVSESIGVWMPLPGGLSKLVLGWMTGLVGLTRSPEGFVTVISGSSRSDLYWYTGCWEAT